MYHPGVCSLWLCLLKWYREKICGSARMNPRLPEIWRGNVRLCQPIRSISHAVGVWHRKAWMCMPRSALMTSFAGRSSRKDLTCSKKVTEAELLELAAKGLVVGVPGEASVVAG